MTHFVVARGGLPWVVSTGTKKRSTYILQIVINFLLKVDHSKKSILGAKNTRMNKTHMHMMVMTPHHILFQSEKVFLLAT